MLIKRTHTLICSICSLLLLTTTPVLADSINDDSIICESPEPLKLLTQDHLKNLPGSVVLKRIQATEKALRLKSEFYTKLNDLEHREAAIRDSSRLPQKGGSTANIIDNSTKKAEALDEAEVNKQFVEQCQVIPKKQDILVIEKHPISKTAKIRSSYEGTEGEFWTTLFYIAQ